MNSASTAKSHTRSFMGTKLQPRQGISAGLFAGLGMMLLWLIGAQVWGPGAASLLTSIGGAFMASGAPATQMVIGVIIHFAISIGLGTLFAVSLDRLDSKDTLIVATFYGFTIWIVAILILRHWIHCDAVQMSRSWWGLLVFLSFGFLLGLFANRFGQAPIDH